MMKSLSSAVAGLRSHQIKMDVIGNNIANVNTYGYKTQRAAFSDIYYQTLGGRIPDTNRGGTNPTQIGYGARLSTIDTIMSNGGASFTGRAGDAYIQGEGFLVVQDADGNNMYTRMGNFSFIGNFVVDYAGHFVLDSNLDLIELGSANYGNFAPQQTSAGYPYMPPPSAGYNAAHAASWGSVSIPLSEIAAVYSNIASAYPSGIMTIREYIKMKEDRYKARLEVLGGEYDDLWNEYGGSASDGLRGDLAPLANQVQLVLYGLPTTDPLHGTLTGLYSSLTTLQNSDWAEQSVIGDIITAIDDPQVGSLLGHLADGIRDKVNEIDAKRDEILAKWDEIEKAEAELTFIENLSKLITDSKINLANLWGKSDWATVSGNDNVLADIRNALEEYGYDSPDNLYGKIYDFFAPSANADTGGWLNTYTTATGQTAGHPLYDAEKHANWSTTLGPGDEGYTYTWTNGASQVKNIFECLTGISISDTGVIYGMANTDLEYPSGTFIQRGHQVNLGTLAIATFTNPEGLSRVGGSFYVPSSSSGEARITTADDEGAGGIVSGYLEMANVEISQQFTDMITTQRGFQANTRIVTVSDEMLQELANLKR